MTSLSLRIIVLRPLPGVTLMVQDKRGALLPPAGTGLRSVWFDFDVRLKPGRVPDFLGAYVQGRPGGRFVYVNVGRLAGQQDSPWTRRAKVPLEGIPVALVRRVAREPGLMLAAAIEGVGRDGGPACASVPLASAWRVVRRRREGMAKRVPAVAPA